MVISIPIPSDKGIIDHKTKVPKFHNSGSFDKHKIETVKQHADNIAETALLSLHWDDIYSEGAERRLENGRNTTFKKDKNRPEPVEWLTHLAVKRRLINLTLPKYTTSLAYRKVINQLYQKNAAFKFAKFAYYTFAFLYLTAASYPSQI